MLQSSRLVLHTRRCGIIATVFYGRSDCANLQKCALCSLLQSPCSESCYCTSNCKLLLVAAAEYTIPVISCADCHRQEQRFWPHGLHRSLLTVFQRRSNVLIFPVKKTQRLRSMIVLVEGNISAGKSTLCTHLGKELDFKLYLSQRRPTLYSKNFTKIPRRGHFRSKCGYCGKDTLRTSRRFDRQPRLASTDAASSSTVPCLVTSSLRTKTTEMAIFQKKDTSSTWSFERSSSTDCLCPTAASISTRRPKRAMIECKT